MCFHAVSAYDQSLFPVFHFTSTWTILFTLLECQPIMITKKKKKTEQMKKNICVEKQARRTI